MQRSVQIANANSRTVDFDKKCKQNLTIHV